MSKQPVDHSPPPPMVTVDEFMETVVNPALTDAHNAGAQAIKDGTAPDLAADIPHVDATPPADAPPAPAGEPPMGEPTFPVGDTGPEPEPAPTPPADAPADDPPLDTRGIKRTPGSVKKKSAPKPKPEPEVPAKPPAKGKSTKQPDEPLRKLTPKDRIKLRALSDAGAIKHKWGEPWVVTKELLALLDAPAPPKADKK